MVKWTKPGFFNRKSPVICFQHSKILKPSNISKINALKLNITLLKQQNKPPLNLNSFANF